ncbi:CopG-like domain-containing protein DNA-binding protein [Tepidicaulis marinus]|uniref:CopG-like domain-containing protein DNA-binding protein n=1 Tax=Tepidicaulis marinus TaxID=1333998 RepID=A0A081BF32_9HYPH|nr:CopG-like domain-containing protein DNA-binding protein [Tepidicaulis marinus]
MPRPKRFKDPVRVSLVLDADVRAMMQFLAAGDHAPSSSVLVQTALEEYFEHHIGKNWRTHYKRLTEIQDRFHKEET